MAVQAKAKPKKINLDELAINTIRFLSVDAVEKANSGHPGMPMGMAPVAYTLWTKFLKHNPKNPSWINRDRFVLSAGHGSMLLYSLLHLTGYDLSLDDLKNFRQWESRTPGHPEYGHTPGVEMTTGPLGQGISTSVGMAIGQRYLNSLFSPKGKPFFDYKIYGIASDGDLMEGISHEACALAGHLGLSSLIFFYDNNHISIDGNTDLSYSDDVKRRFESYHWNVLTINDANDINVIEQTLKKALTEKSKPTLIITRSHIGFGSPNKADSAEAHGSPLGADETKLSKENLGWPTEPAFYIPENVERHFIQAIAKGEKFEAAWKTRFDKWAQQNPDLKKLFDRLSKGELPHGWETKLPDFSAEDKIATRAASGKVLNAIAGLMPELVGGSADLAPSNNTFIKGVPAFSKDVTGRNFHFGVREHGMSALLNGMALTDMLIPYGGTFLIFSDYMKGGMRISALIKKRVVYVLTHDSIGLGEDGPTHQPIEQLAALRATPNMTVIRPADANETAAAWVYALQHKTGPVVMALSRQNLPVLKKSTYPAIGHVDKGAYVLSDAPNGQPEIILIATGSEVSLALGAQKKLQEQNIPTRVVSMPSMEIFEQQSADYKESVLPAAVKLRISIEALSTFGWARYVGLDGESIGMTTFGASAPGNIAMEKFGFTVDNIVARGIALRRR